MCCSARSLSYPQGAPGAVGTFDADIPKLTAYPAPAGNDSVTAVVLCPGGGYQGLAMDHEGKQIAEWLNGQGISAFELQYRHGPRYYHPAKPQDAQRAIRTMRAGASKSELLRTG